MDAIDKRGRELLSTGSCFRQTVPEPAGMLVISSLVKLIGIGVLR